MVQDNDIETFLQTGRDTVELLETIIERVYKDPRDKLYSIMTSRCSTKVTKYFLYQKVMQVKTQLLPRKSHRRRSANSSTNVSGDHKQLCILLILELLCRLKYYYSEYSCVINLFLTHTCLCRNRHSRQDLQDSHSK